MKKNRIFQSVFVLLLQVLAMPMYAQQINLDKPIKAGELTVFPDIQNEKVYYYVSDKPRLATDANGRPQFSFLRYVDNNVNSPEQPAYLQGTGGGIVHAVVSLAVTRDQIREAERELQRIKSDAVLQGPVVYRSGRFGIISAVRDPQGGLSHQVLGIGAAPILDGQKAAVSIQLTREGAKILWESFKTTTPDISFTFEMEVSGYRSPKNAKIEADFDQIYAHSAFNGGFANRFLAAEIRAAYDDLRRNGSIKVTQIGEDEKMEALITTAYNKIADMMFSPMNGTGALSLADLGSIASGSNGSMLDRATNMLRQNRQEARDINRENEQRRLAGNNGNSGTGATGNGSTGNSTGSTGSGSTGTGSTGTGSSGTSTGSSGTGSTSSGSSGTSSGSSGTRSTSSTGTGSGSTSTGTGTGSGSGTGTGTGTGTSTGTGSTSTGSSGTGSGSSGTGSTGTGATRTTGTGSSGSGTGSTSTGSGTGSSSTGTGSGSSGISTSSGSGSGTGTGTGSGSTSSSSTGTGSTSSSDLPADRRTGTTGGDYEPSTAARRNMNPPTDANNGSAANGGNNGGNNTANNPRDEEVPTFAIVASFEMKVVHHSGKFTIDLNKATADRISMRFDENIGNLTAFRADTNMFREFNMEDPLFVQREIVAMVDGVNSQDFGQYINFVNVRLKKTHQSGQITNREIRIDRNNFNREGNIFKMIYGYKGDVDRQVWFDYEFETEWSFFGGNTVSVPLQRAKGGAINLSPPIQKRTVEFQADQARLTASNVRLITVKLIYTVNGREQTKTVTLNPAQNRLSERVDFMLPADAFQFQFEVAWTLSDNTIRRSARQTSESAIVFVDNVTP